VKTDEEAREAIEKAHRYEAAFAERLRQSGLCVEERSHGFRASVDDIVDYEHDIDLKVEGYCCQYKHRHVWLCAFTHGNWPIVDEKVKADRTPVDFYILRFCDGIIVVPYEPETWGLEEIRDRKDRATKWFYTVSPVDCIPLTDWIESFVRTA
jgi:hypothetical protein